MIVHHICDNVQKFFPPFTIIIFSLFKDSSRNFEYFSDYDEIEPTEDAGPEEDQFKAFSDAAQESDYVDKIGRFYVLDAAEGDNTAW